MAVTVNTSASQIYLTGTGSITVNEVCIVIGNNTIMEESPANTFTIKGSRELEVRTGVELQTENGDTIGWDLSAAKYPILDIQSGAILTVAPKTTWIGDINHTQYSYIYFYGTVQMNASSGNEIVWEYFRSIYLSFRDETDMIWNYVIFRNLTYSSGYFLYMDGAASLSTINFLSNTFTNLTFTDSNEYGYLYIVRCDLGSWTIENWNISNIYSAFNLYSNSALKFKNLIITDTVSYESIYDNGGSLTIAALNTSKTENQHINGILQGLLVFEDCTWNGTDANYYGLYNYNGNTTLLINPIFQNLNRAITVTDSIVMIYGTPTYTSVTIERVWVGSGTFLYVRRYTITVKDQDGDAIQNAMISIREQSGRAYLQAFTDANGQFSTQLKDNFVYLPEKEETSLNNFTTWDDYDIVVTHADYDTYRGTVTMDQDQVETITLKKMTATSGATYRQYLDGKLKDFKDGTLQREYT